ncbi:MAG TPA: glutaredoxin family protein [Myxococcales bacterium]|jgi:glutaredoxin
MSSFRVQLSSVLTLALVLAGLFVAFWVLMTLAPAETANGFSGGTYVREQNRAAGRWLRERNAPRPKCGPDEVVRAADVEGLYSWTDESGVHYVEDPSQVPEKYRSGSKVDALPVLQTYSGAYSRLKTSNRGVKPAERIEAAKATAIVYSAEWCGACKDTKAFLKSLGVTVEERDIEKDPKANAELVKIAGEDAGIPVTVIGKKVIGGFDEAALRAAVGK